MEFATDAIGCYRGKEISPGSLDSVDSLAGTLAIRRYCHGLVKLTIYPDSYSRNAREAKAGYMRAAKLDDNSAHEAKMAKISREYVEDMYPTPANQAKRLVSRMKFQRDIDLLPGKGGLPRRKKFSANGALVINEVGQVATERYGKSGVFLTGTIPGTGAALNDVVAKYSGSLVNRVRQWFRAWFTQDYAVINVWEFQKRGMLHIHLCVFSHEKKILEKIKREWKARWNRLLIELSDDTGIDLFRKNERKTWRNQLWKTRQDAQWIKFSVAQYMAKYLSKSSREQATQSASHPSRWWGVSRSTAREAKERRVTLRASGILMSDAKHLISEIFAVMPGVFDGVIMRSKEEVPGVQFGGKFFEAAQSFDVVFDVFRFLGELEGLSLEANIGEG